MVVDADCLVAGVLTASGATSELLARWREGELELIVCPRLLREVAKALRDPRIATRYDIAENGVQSFVARLAEQGVMFEDAVDPPRYVPNDPKDDYLFDLALRSSADCLVTRDRDFEKVDVTGLRITTLRQLVRELRDSAS